MKLNTNLQKRCAFMPTGTMLREEEGKDPIIAGTAIVTERETVLWEGSDWREIEVIAQSCIAEDFIREQDIKLNMYHDRSKTLARTGGTLNVVAREGGLDFETPAPKCAIGEEATELIRTKVITGCSFEFWPKDYEVTEREAADGKKEYVIRHTAFRSIGAVTLAMDPAYPQTEVGLRELYREINHITDDNDPDAEAAKREAELKAQAEKEAEEKFTRERSVSAMQKELELMELQN